MAITIGLGFLLIALGYASAWNVTFEEETVTVHMTEKICVNFVAPVTEADIATGILSVSSTRESVATVEELPVLSSATVNNSVWSSCLNVSGIFLGSVDLVMSISSSEVLPSIEQQRAFRMDAGSPLNRSVFPSRVTRAPIHSG